MGYAKIPPKDAVLFVRAMGLLVNQAGIYGPSHNVTQLAIRSVFSELGLMLKTHGPIEVVLEDKQVLVNGSNEGLDVSAGKNLADRMILHKIGGLVFLDPPDVVEFSRCITLFGTPPQVLAAEGGFEAALKRADLKSVQAVTVAYQRVAGNAPELQQETPAAASQPAAPSPTPPPTTRRPVEPMSGVLDLSSALSDSGDEGAPSGGGGDQDLASSARRQRASSVATLLRETAALLEAQPDQSEFSRNQAVIKALERIRGVLSEMTGASEQHITSLANQVDADRQTIASIESAAKRRGIGLKLTREDLIKQYAELNQEIVQPLTVSTGVLGMLCSGHAGNLSASQRDLLRLAEDSVGRVNQLVAYMNRISGLPDSFTPDEKIIGDTYR